MLLGAGHARAAFSCGVDSLDRYLRERAGQDQRRGAAVCYVLTEADSARVIGYYTLSATSVRRLTDVPAALKRRLPRYPDVPATLLGCLAVDQTFQGSGMGEMLLADALRRVLLLRQELGVAGVVVDAEDEGVIAFYERFDFQRLGAGSKRLFLPLAAIESAL